MKYTFTARARREVNAIVRFYAQENRRSAVAFVEELDRLLIMLLDNPRLGRPVSSSFRRISVPTFPYFLYYTLHGSREVIEISMVCHQRRGPDYWKDLVEEPAACYDVSRAAA